MDVEGKPVNQGDGLKLGNWVGAAVQQHHAPMIHWMGGTYGGTGMDMSPVGTAPFLYLNKDGKRFTNEDIPGQQMQNQIENQPGRMLFQFFDGNWAEQWPPSRSSTAKRPTRWKARPDASKPPHRLPTTYRRRTSI